jgi:hypothetical protein
METYDPPKSPHFSSGQLARFRLSTMLTADARQRRAAGRHDTSQLKLLRNPTQADVGRRSSFFKTDARQNLIAEISGGARAIVRFDFP